ncbi:hypothetical protein [Streptomyces griseocarneus]|uniref:hypothetical protein n=1 Tax=Streptomyces griseocarneus TaxID=51201 RepID=UPI00167D3385|nr:hypothetical protein [Streptomyces griseocarneus]MBZ6475491.1 hypothetical protein [Streptomyces griseocarneus]GHG75590.1 hypothetical protein GCM10018779_53350 [Streptomyces griseocarneus]
MLGRTLLATTALAAAMTVPAAFPDAAAAVRAIATLSNADNGRSVTVHQGDRVRVQLRAVTRNGEKWAWDEPTTSAPDVLGRDSGSTASNGDASADFTASALGAGDITAHRRCVVARPGHTCPHVTPRWKVTIHVK